MRRLIDILQSKNIGDGKVIKLFAFTVRVDVVGKAVCLFETCRKVGADVDGEKGINTASGGRDV